jgi:DNA-binding protein YbaB
MSFDDEFLKSEESETGSDELLSNDHLRLPEAASPLVRLHAIRAWLSRRQQETSIEIGDAALTLQQLMEEEPQMSSRPRRRERLGMMERVQQAQQELQQAQQRLHAYEEAQEMLEDCITHTTPGERALVEYYLALEEAMQNDDPESSAETTTPHRLALMDVQHRVEHVSAPYEDD